MQHTHGTDTPCVFSDCPMHIEEGKMLTEEWLYLQEDGDLEQFLFNSEEGEFTLTMTFDEYDRLGQPNRVRISYIEVD